MGKKVCTNPACHLVGIQQPLEAFHRSRRERDGRKPRCKHCFAQYNKKLYYADLKRTHAKDRAYYTKNKDAINKHRRVYAANHREQKRRQDAKGYRRHAESRKVKVREYQRTHREQLREYYHRNSATILAQRRARYHRKRPIWMSTKCHKLKQRMRTIVRRGLRDGKGGRRWEDLVGYTIDDLVQHLENLAYPHPETGAAMCFRGADALEDIDIHHKKPLAAFNYVSHEDPAFKECWALSNLAPLWREDHMKTSTWGYGAVKYVEKSL